MKPFCSYPQGKHETLRGKTWNPVGGNMKPHEGKHETLRKSIGGLRRDTNPEPYLREDVLVPKRSAR